MKYLTFLIITVLTLGAKAQEKEVPKIVSHGIYGELWGAGVHGSIGYKLSFNFKPRIITNCYAGVGAIISRNTNPSSALTVPIGISEEFRFLKFMSIEAGIFGTAYFNYTATFTKNTKDCFGMSTCPPDNDFLFTTFIGTNFFIKELSICPRINLYLPNWWTNQPQFWPSLAIRYTFKH